jgi:predicted MPP superfamily phosphohydrolase
MRGLRINGQRLLRPVCATPLCQTNFCLQPARRHAAARFPFKGDGLFKILLVHRRSLPATRATFDLIVSGHAHGGQVRIPFLDVGLYSHGVIFPKYTAGVHSLGGSRMAVSRGLSRFWFPPRVFNPPEIVSLVLKEKGPDVHEAGGN